MHKELEQCMQSTNRRHSHTVLGLSPAEDIASSKDRHFLALKLTVLDFAKALRQDAIECESGAQVE